MKSTKSQTAQRPRGNDLDSRYGEIGISAVVAALQYKSETKIPAEAPVSAPEETIAAPEEKWLADIAA